MTQCCANAPQFVATHKFNFGVYYCCKAVADVVGVAGANVIAVANAVAFRAIVAAALVDCFV